MDPNETLRLLAEALLEKNKYDANEHYFALRAWIERGGFEPAWTSMSRQQFFSQYDPRTGSLSK
jgi:hypothetical protein